MRKCIVIAILGWGGLARADAAYSLKVVAPPARKAHKSVAKIHIAPSAGYHMNKDYPTSVVAVDVPAGVLIEKVKLTGKDAVKLQEDGADFDLSFTSAEAGKKTITYEIKFAVCTQTTCDPKKEKLAFTVEVN